MDKNTFYTMAHTNDPTVVSPDANEESFNRPVDADPKKTNPYNDVYYGYGYVENMKFKPSENSGGGGSSGGGGGATGDGVTQEEMVQAINKNAVPLQKACCSRSMGITFSPCWPMVKPTTPLPSVYTITAPVRNSPRK